MAAKSQRRRNVPLQLAFDFGGTPTGQRFSAGSAMQWMAGQLEGICHNAPPPKRKRGMGRNGTTRKVLEWMRQHSGWLLHHQIREQLGCSKGALDWALRWLRRMGLVEATPFVQPAGRPVLLYHIAGG